MHADSHFDVYLGCGKDASESAIDQSPIQVLSFDSFICFAIIAAAEVYPPGELKQIAFVFGCFALRSWNDF